MFFFADMLWENSDFIGNSYPPEVCGAILRSMEKDFDVFAAVEKGELGRIADWLRERVFSCASVMTPDEWIRNITGESLNPDYYLSYLEEKYSRLYQLN